MTLEYCGAIDSEDGLLLFGDAAILHLWRGNNSEPIASTQLESALGDGAPGTNIPIAHKSGVIWDLEGPGTTDVFRDQMPGKIILVRSWLEDPLESETESEAVLGLGSLSFSPDVAFAEFQIESGTLAILWPTESGECIREIGPFEYSLEKRDMMTASSGMLVPVEKGHYQCFHDNVETLQGEARRCTIVFVRAGD
jgi:hypothetical protein